MEGVAFHTDEIRISWSAIYAREFCSSMRPVENCGAPHWNKERVDNCSKFGPVFTCYSGGKVRLLIAKTQQAYIDLFDNIDLSGYIRTSSHMFALTSLSADVDRNLLKWF